MGIRRKAREVALQTLYILDFNEEDPVLGNLAYIGQYSEVLNDVAESNNIEIESGIFTFADNLLKTTLSNIEAIDNEIGKYAKNWKFDRIAILDKNIMRIATGEILFSEVPSPIIINEAIEVAKKFCSDKSGKFINGVLNTIAHENRDDKEKKDD